MVGETGLAGSDSDSDSDWKWGSLFCFQCFFLSILEALMGKKRKVGRFVSHGEIKSTQRVPDQRGPGGFSLFVERERER